MADTDMMALATAIGKLAKAQNPEAYGDYSDAEIGARLLVQQNQQVHALFSTTNEKDPETGAAVVRDPMLAFRKAESIGAPGLGEHYVAPTYQEILASDNPFKALLEAIGSHLVGPGRPKSVAGQDPLGLEAWQQGKGPMPIMMGTIDEVGPRGIRAYHGSPHDFHAFDSSKIGTGEGAQAYGHGLYFAENEGTAQAYKNALGQDAILYPSGHKVVPTPGSVDDQALATLATYTDPRHSPSPNPYQAAIADVERRRGGGYESAERLDALIARLRQWEKTGATASTQGHMYEVAIQAHPDHFLDWDKPLSEQSPQVQQAIARLRAEAGDIQPVRLKDGSYSVTKVSPDGSGRVVWDVKAETPDAALQQYHEWSQSAPGADVYHDLTRANMGREMHPAQASDVLKQAGIPGIKYLDAGSRMSAGGELIDVSKTPEGWRSTIRVSGRPQWQNAGTDTAFTKSQPFATEAEARAWADDKINGGTRNYVVFDDKLVDILRKYGLLPPLIGGAIGKALRSTPSRDQQ